MNRVIHFFIAMTLIAGFAFSQTIRKLDIPAGATDLADPPYKRYQHLRQGGVDMETIELDLSVEWEIIDGVIELDSTDYQSSIFLFEADELYHIDYDLEEEFHLKRTLQEAETLFNHDGPWLKESLLEFNHSKELPNQYNLKFDPGISVAPAHWWHWRSVPGIDNLKKPQGLSPFLW